VVKIVKNTKIQDMLASKEKQIIATAVAVTELKMRLIMDVVMLWQRNLEKSSNYEIIQDNVVRFLLTTVKEMKDNPFITVLRIRNKMDRDLAYKRIEKRLSRKLREEFRKGKNAYLVKKKAVN